MVKFPGEVKKLVESEKRRQRRNKKKGPPLDDQPLRTYVRTTELFINREVAHKKGAHGGKHRMVTLLED